jgi:hypothetical protein
VDFDGLLCIRIKVVESAELTGVVSEQNQKVLGIGFGQNLNICKQNKLIFARVINAVNRKADFIHNNL